MWVYPLMKKLNLIYNSNGAKYRIKAKISKKIAKL